MRLVIRFQSHRLGTVTVVCAYFDLYWYSVLLSCAPFKWHRVSVRMFALSVYRLYLCMWSMLSEFVCSRLCGIYVRWPKIIRIWCGSFDEVRRRRNPHDNERNDPIHTVHGGIGYFAIVNCQCVRGGNVDSAITCVWMHWESRHIRRQIEMMTALVMDAGVWLYIEWFCGMVW